MLKSNYFKYFFLFFLIFFHSLIYSNELSLTSWVASILSSQKDFPPFPHKVVFIKEFQPSNKTEIFNINRDIFNEYGFLKSIKTKNLDWSFKLNRFDQYQGIQEEPKDVYSYHLFSRLADIDTVFFIHPKKNWIALKANSAYGEVQKIEQKNTSFILDPIHVYEWFERATGFNGVVLDKNQDRILVGSTQTLLSVGEQGVIYKKTFDQFKVQKQQTDEAGAIIECVNHQNGYGIFQILVYGSQIYPGDKIEIIKKEKI